MGSTVIKIFDMTVVKAGLGEADAEAAGFDPVVSLAPSLDCAHYRVAILDGGLEGWPYDLTRF